MQPDWIIEMLDRLEPDLREDYEERAGVMEYDGGLPRDHAECLALLNIIRKHPAALLPSYIEGTSERRTQR